MGNGRPTTSAEVVASLEGMRVVVKPQSCELHEYNFEENCWQEVSRSACPMTVSQAETWVEGWNDVDRRTAVVLLTSRLAE
jgi:hypothetical protein